MHFPRLRTVLGAGIVTVALAAPVVAWSALKGDEPPHAQPASAPALRDTTMADAVEENARAADEAHRWHNLAVLQLRNVSDLLAAQEAQAAAARVRSSGGGSGGGCGADMACRRQCEAGGNYATNTGNGYYGAYQFDLGTWQGVGGSGLPSGASPEEQDARAQTLYDQRGNAPWPNC